MKISNFIGSIKPELLWIEGPEGSQIQIIDPTSRRGQFAIGAAMTISDLQTLREHAEADEEAAKARHEAMQTKTVGELLEAEANTVLALFVDWKGIKDDEDKEIPFNKKLARELYLMSEDFKKAVDTGVEAAVKSKAEEVKVAEEVKKS